MVGATSNEELIEKVARVIEDPEESQRLKTENAKLKEEADALKAELLVVKENSAATAEIAKETRRLAEQVKAVFGETGSAATKAKLFDEKVLEDKKVSGARMVRILSDFAEQVEGLMKEARESANRIEESCRKLTLTGTNLSDMSLPDSILEMLNKEERTPKSKNSEKMRTPETPGATIDFTSPGSGKEEPAPNTQDRSRNLNEVFEQTAPGNRSPLDKPEMEC